MESVVSAHKTKIKTNTTLSKTIIGYRAIESRGEIANFLFDCLVKS